MVATRTGDPAAVELAAGVRWSEALRDVEALGALLRDVLRVEPAHGRRGRSLEYDGGLVRFRALFGEL